VKKFILIAAIAIFGVAVASATASLAVKKIPFSGSYSGQATTKVDGNTATISATATGKGTIGAGTLTGTGTGDTSQQPCVPFGGTGKITGTSGTSISFTVVSGAKGCGDEGGHEFSVSGYVKVTKATGKLAKATGTLKFTGVYSHDDGSFSVKFTGTLKK
jgi:hypothetical protein